MTNEEAKVFLNNLKICIDEHPVVADWLVEIANRKTEPQTDGYMTSEQTEDYRKMLDKAEYKVYGNIEDEPQTDIEIARAIVHKAIDDAVIAEDAYPDLRQKMHDAVDNYEPQTDCAWKKGEER